MATIKKADILINLETFLDELEYYRYSRLPIVAERLSRRQVVYIAYLRTKLLQDIGKYRALITELTNIEEPEIPQKGDLRSSALWLKCLEQQFDFQAVQALDYCIDIVNVAIGKLKDDIEKGYRDNNGNITQKPNVVHATPPKAFISHGKKSIILSKLENFLIEIGVEPLIVSKQPSLDKTLNVKVEYYLDQADFVVILATGDDTIDNKLSPRQNVIHEIGLAQKTHPGKIIYLLEENTQFPSNIRTKVWEQFNQENLENIYTHIIVELKEFGLLYVTSPQE